MAYLTIGEMKTHLYEEIQQAVVNNDNTILQDAVDTALDEARGYLTKYDIDEEYNRLGPDRNKKLLSVVKDIAAWEIICLANPNIEIDFRLQRYEFALNWLKMVQAGKTDPKLPALVAPTNTTSQGSSGIKWDSNPKRRNQY